MSTGHPGFAKVQGGTVYYLYEAPNKKTELKNELKVLEAFLGKWNADVGVRHSLPPHAAIGDTCSPPGTRLIVTKGNHISTHASYATQGEHLSVYVCTDDNWACNPRHYGAVVHIFAVNGEPAKGYHSYFLHSKKEQKFNSEAIKAAIANAEANDLGTLRQGDLA
ncbi:hypothetical protein BDZ97DRAFT_1676646 [Flammula alnicola]|nr:hypothetical protein BDZ97DRAFT_1676646 [Flammula alnicola]